MNGERDLVGRDDEIAAIDRLLDSVGGPRAGGSAQATALVLTGSAGIGKSTLWRETVDRAEQRGFALMSCRPAASELRLSYAGLGDLVGGVAADVFDTLPPPQRRAIDAAMLRGPEDGAAPEQTAVVASFLSLVTALAHRAPVLLAVDDIQWLDEPSLRAVQFASRRCSGAVAMLAAQRLDDGDVPIEFGPADPARVERLHIGPLTLGALHHVVTRHTAGELPRHTMVEIAERSGGNPFYALELARAAERSERDVVALPATLRSAVRRRLGSLAPETVRALCAASALADPSLDTVSRVLNDVDALGHLGPAEDAGVVTVAAGGVEFTHPLFASAVYADMAPTARRELHRRISALVDDVEERARHLALAAVTADADAIAALDRAAAHARRRGAPGTAAELLDRAIDLGACHPERRVQAAEDHLHAGSPERAWDLVDAALDTLPAGPMRARAFALQAVVGREHEYSPAADRLLARAIEEAGPDLALRAAIGLQRCWELVNSGRIGAARPAAVQAADDADRTGESGLIAETLAVRVTVDFLLGEAVDEGALARALDLEDPDRPTALHSLPSYVAARIDCHLHRLEASRARFEVVRQRCRDRGAEFDLWIVEFWLMRLACQTGDVATAERIARSYDERLALVPTKKWKIFVGLAQAWVHAWVGRAAEARAAVDAAAAHFEGSENATLPLFAAEATCVAEPAADHPEATVEAVLAPLHEVIAAGYNEPSAFQMTPDVVAALVVLGRTDEAVPLVEWLEASGRKQDRAWAAAVGARCRALLHAAAGDDDAAEEAFGRALDAHALVPDARYDRARTLLAAGQADNRQGRRRDGAARIEAAAELFDEVGMTQWAATARAELGRSGIRPTSAADVLTAAERRVAALASSGLTNREIASRLFVSPKTIEAHLGRVYRKLGIRNRAELTRHLSSPERSG